MRRRYTVFLQAVVVLLGIGVLAAMLWEPHLEGRNANATLSEIYFGDPFLAYVYIASVPFFVALVQAFRVLGYAGQNRAFSQAAVNALRTIKTCAFITAGAILAADAFLLIQARLYPEVGATDGPEGAVVLGMVATFASLVIGSGAAVLQRVLQNAVDLKSENDLTV